MLKWPSTRDFHGRTATGSSLMRSSPRPTAQASAPPPYRCCRVCHETGAVRSAPTRHTTRAGSLRACSELNVTPHVTQNLARRGGSAIDARTTGHIDSRARSSTRDRSSPCASSQLNEKGIEDLIAGQESGSCESARGFFWRANCLRLLPPLRRTERRHNNALDGSRTAHGTVAALPEVLHAYASNPIERLRQGVAADGLRQPGGGGANSIQPSSRLHRCRFAGRRSVRISFILNLSRCSVLTREESHQPSGIVLRLQQLTHVRGAC